MSLGFLNPSLCDTQRTDEADGNTILIASPVDDNSMCVYVHVYCVFGLILPEISVQMSMCSEEINFALVSFAFLKLNIEI